MQSFLYLSFGVCICVRWARQRGVGPGWYHWMPPPELAKEELYCNGTWILILTPLLPGCVTSASLLCSLSLGWCM